MTSPREARRASGYDLAWALMSALLIALAAWFSLR